MAYCPACNDGIDVDEFDVDRGDELSCPACGSNLVVAGLAPVALDLAPDVPEHRAVWMEDDDEEEAKPFH